ncbi:MAG: InlB B-repeat-containing protein [Eubacterium sp.]|nr:InlB B-repeat-containing protein [Eubacterium sp.]
MKRTRLRNIVICSLLLSLLAGSTHCAAAEEAEKTWSEIRPFWSWSPMIWSGGWGKARELASDNVARLADEKVFTVPEGTITLSPDGIPNMGCDVRRVTEIKLPQSLRVIKTGSIQGFALQKITIPCGVTEIAPHPLIPCDNLRTICNLSTQPVDVPDMDEDSGILYGHFFGFDYYVDGEKVTEVPPGKTAVAKGRTFSLTYKLNKGTLTGKKVTSYQVGENTKLPGAKRKGYTFLGWSYNNRPETWFTLYDENSTSTGDKKLVARWKKIGVEKTGKKKIRIKIYNRGYQDNWPVACLYSTKKNMEGAKLIHLGVDHSKETKNVVKENEKNYNIKINKKSGLLTCDMKNLKKGKTYYMQFRRINEFYQDKHYYVNKRVLKKVKVKL